MRTTIIFLTAILFSPSIYAGCIGPVIMGECKGQSVKWDTHAGQNNKQAPAGTYYDKRGTTHQQENFNDVNPYTGRDAHDSDWFGSSDGMPVYDYGY